MGKVGDFGAWRERAQSIVRGVLARARRYAWRPTRLRAALRRAFAEAKSTGVSGSYTTWRRAIKDVAGSFIRGLDDPRQLLLPSRLA